jgi:phenylalanine-4-hydroxylase
MHFELNEVTAKLPKHLHQFILNQPYDSYTPEDQAVWRYVMRLNVEKLKSNAHESYLKGLEQTGIEIDTIPRMEGMNRILKEIGWAAVSVNGFIPPSAFMEFQAYNVLVIAADIRTLEHIAYTPAPDIIHEAAGHAPIIANPEYAEYLRRFGEIGSKAIASKYDKEVYEAIRTLSIVKEHKNASQESIDQAEARVLDLQSQKVDPSELAQIRNLHWWTVEYGLIGSIDNPKIYGAGLLSSIGESEYCMSEAVKKKPYNLLAANQNFDITKPQPQLYVTPNFAHLSYVLEEFANTMSLRNGGLDGVQKLISSEQLGTVELSTGLQISGVFSTVLKNDENPIYIQTTGPTAFAYREKELIGHSCSYHAEGFGSPVGKLKNFNLAIEDMSPKDLEVYGIKEGEQVNLCFEGGVEVSGEIITGTRNLQGKIMIISFRNCTVRRGEQILFQPEWGVYDMAVGKSIISAFGGAADPSGFDFSDQVSNFQIKSAEVSDLTKELYQVHESLKEQRLNFKSSEFEILLALVLDKFSDKWLLVLELKELMVIHSIENLAIDSAIESLRKGDKRKLIEDGLELLEQSFAS